MEKITLEEKYILEYIKTMISELKEGKYTVNNARYHHNSSYNNAASICRYGILTLNDLHRLKIKKFSEEFLKVMSDTTSHVNGNEQISLSVVGLTDLYPDESEFFPECPIEVDFIISSSIPAARHSRHYGNEYLSRGSISNKDIKSVDTRLLKMIELMEQGTKLPNYHPEELIKKFNCLKDIALVIKETNLNIPIREMSDNQEYLLNIDKISKNPQLILKK